MTRLTQIERTALRKASVAPPVGSRDHEMLMQEARRLQAEALGGYLKSLWRASGLASLACAIRRAVCRWRTQAALGRLNDAMLRDIGLERSQIWRAAAETSRRKNPYPANWLTQLAVEVERAATRRQTIRDLSSLDDRILRDIGIERGTIEELASAQVEGRAPAWRFETDPAQSAPGAAVKLGAAILLPFYLLLRKPANRNETMERRAA